MTRQRYSIKESWNRILRLFQGLVPNEQAGTLDGTVLSENQAISDYAELLGGSLPGHTYTLPQAVIDAVTDAGFITGTSTSGVNVMLDVSGTYSSNAIAPNMYLMVHESATGTSIELPLASSHDAQVYHIKKINNLGNVNIYPKPVDMVDGAQVLFITTQYSAVSLASNGNNWWIV